MRKIIFVLFLLLSISQVSADIPATPVMTLYQFNGRLEIPYYDIDTFRRSGTSSPAGYLAQGSSVIPCLVVRDNYPLADRHGTPYVGFKVVLNSRTATREAVQAFKAIVKRRKLERVVNHHCDSSVRHVINVRKLYAMGKSPAFDPPFSRRSVRVKQQSRGQLDTIIRAFHNSPYCDSANRRLVGRRAALRRGWSDFIRSQWRRWNLQALKQARHLDYVMRTAIFEGHLDRGCNAYGACERNIIALSIRNRGLESCIRYQGCRFQGDFEGVATKVSQYNIWDEYLTQVSGLTSCFLRDDLVNRQFTSGRRHNVDYYKKLQDMYGQNLVSVQRILFGTDQDLRAIFPNNTMSDLKRMKHYYHAPAMGKCFPNYNRVEYMSGAIAWNGNNFALIANTRIQIDKKAEDGYFFRNFVLQQRPDRDDIRIVNDYPGFIVDERKVLLRKASRCLPYGIPRGCRFNRIGRYRKTPSWLNSGKPLALTCRVRDRGESCYGGGESTTVIVGGSCDTQMRPVTGIR